MSLFRLTAATIAAAGIILSVLAFVTTGPAWVLPGALCSGVFVWTLNSEDMR